MATVMNLKVLHQKMKSGKYAGGIDASAAHWSTPCSDCATELLGVPASKFQELSAAKKDKPLLDAMKKTFWVLRVDVGRDNSQKPFLRVLKVEGKSSDMPVATERSGESMLDEVSNNFTPKSARHFQTTLENPMYSMSESLAESISSSSVRSRVSSGSSLRTGKRNVSGKTRDNGKQRVDAEVPLPESPKKNVSDVASQTIVETAKPIETSVSTMKVQVIL
ncbi:hypothetical protein R1sor_012753 [Riccia sorocarpa]|uniref:Uncharacterized protein n=1 Tax=Riccia sorocarpa TaxID=122646 RepID=A0ABD3I7D9_9MARC